MFQGDMISEPMTLFTDYLIMAQCLYFFFALRRVNINHESSIRLISWAFFFISVAAFAGGTVHGFRPVLSAGAEDFLWVMTLYSTGVVSFLFSLGVARSVMHPRWNGVVAALFGIKLVLFVSWVTVRSEFLLVIIDYGTAMLMVLAFMLYSRVHWKLGNEIWFFWGILVLAVGAMVQVGGVSPHEHFNHNDLYHVIQMLGFYLFFRGACNMTDRASRKGHLLASG